MPNDERDSQRTEGRPLAIDPVARRASNTEPAFVARPAGAPHSRAGLVWEVSDKHTFQVVCPMEQDRWGVWVVSFPFPMTSTENVRLNLESILPELKQRWKEWRSTFGKG